MMVNGQFFQMLEQFLRDQLCKGKGQNRHKDKPAQRIGQDFPALFFSLM